MHLDEPRWSGRHQFDTRLLPVEKLLYQSDLAVAGLWRCPPDAPWFRDSGPARNNLFVFPRSVVRIRRKNGGSFVSDAAIVTLYNRGDEYTREAISSRGDHADWFSVEPGVLAEATSGFGTRAGGGVRPFSLTYVWSSAHACLVQRRLVARLINSPGITPLEVDETVLHLLASLFPARRYSISWVAERHVRLTERARELVASRYAEPLLLSNLAQACQVSPWFLARVFRRVTGTTIHQYQRQLRLRASLERVLEGEDLTRVALDLGFSSHSHFTESFRRAFGTPPTGLRRSASADCRAGLPRRTRIR